MVVQPEHERALRLRVIRLLSDQFVPEDITRLFLMLRAKSLSRQTVEEIGHFLAHPERDSGQTTKLTRVFFTIIQFQLRHIAEGEPTLNIDFGNLPITFPDAMRFSLARVGSDLVFKRTGLKARAAKAALDAALTKFTIDGERWTQTNVLTEQEIKLFITLIFTFVGKDEFNDYRLFSELIGCLRGNDLLHNEELEDFGKLRAVISLFAISTLHNCLLHLEGAEFPVRLLGTIEPDGLLSVRALCDVRLRDGQITTIASLLFGTSLRASDYCDPVVVPPNTYGSWKFAVELGHDRLLRPLPGQEIAFVPWDLGGFAALRPV